MWDVLGFMHHVKPSEVELDMEWEGVQAPDAATLNETNRREIFVVRGRRLLLFFRYCLGATC